jgi:hypothetical protein
VRERGEASRSVDGCFGVRTAAAGTGWGEQKRGRGPRCRVGVASSPQTMASFRGECPAPTGDEGIPLVRLRVKEMARLSGESSGQQGGPDEERNGGVEDVDVLGHDASFDGSVCTC